MGFLDKAKKMAEQAQAKLDEAQQQFNSSQQSGQSSAPPVEYDNHGRPIAQDAPASTSPPHGDPVTSTPPPPPAGSPPAPPAPADAPVGQGDPLGAAAAATPPPPTAPQAQPTGDAPAEDRNHPSYAPPKLSSGDPLAG
jgi:formin 2/WAS/WASL-interacting protein